MKMVSELDLEVTETTTDSHGEKHLSQGKVTEAIKPKRYVTNCFCQHWEVNKK